MQFHHEDPVTPRVLGSEARLLAGAGEPEDVGGRRLASLQRSQKEREVGAEDRLHPQGARDLERLTLPDQDDEVAVGTNDIAKAIDVCLLVEVDALRKLDDAPAGEVLEHRLAQALLPRPEVPEVASSVEEDRAVAQDGVERVGRVRAHVAGVDDIGPKALYEHPLADPDRAVAGVVVVREADERAARARGNERAQDDLRLGGELGDQRLAAHVQPTLQRRGSGQARRPSRSGARRARGAAWLCGS